MENLSSEMRQLSFIDEDLDCIPSSVSNKKSIQTRKLILNHNKIQSLVGLEWFAKLEELDLDNNIIDDRTEFPFIESLKTLSLNNNKVTKLQDFLEKIFKSFPSLIYLSLLGNKACPAEFSDPSNTPQSYQRYRFQVACFLPSLRFLEWKPVTDAERLKGREIFVKLSPSALANANMSSKAYNPLPKTDENLFVEGEGKAVAGKVRYKYVGRKSEGNRFIRNKDL